MRIPGLILILATAGLTLAVIWAGDILLSTPATTIGLFGNQMDLAVGEIFAAGIAAGVLTTIGLVMILKGVGRNTSSHSTGRHQLRGDRHEIHDLHETTPPQPPTGPPTPRLPTTTASPADAEQRSTIIHDCRQPGAAEGTYSAAL